MYGEKHITKTNYSCAAVPRPMSNARAKHNAHSLLKHLRVCSESRWHWRAHLLQITTLGKSHVKTVTVVTTVARYHHVTAPRPRHRQAFSPPSALASRSSSGTPARPNIATSPHHQQQAPVSTPPPTAPASHSFPYSQPAPAVEKAVVSTNSMSKKRRPRARPERQRAPPWRKKQPTNQPTNRDIKKASQSRYETTNSWNRQSIMQQHFFETSL